MFDALTPCAHDRRGGHGRAGDTGLFEGVVFDTPVGRLGWLNETVAVGRGSLAGDRLTIELFAIVR